MRKFNLITIFFQVYFYVLHVLTRYYVRLDRFLKVVKLNYECLVKL